MVKKRNELFDWIKAFLIAFLIAFVVRAFITSPIIVDDPSMEPTLYDSAQIIVHKFNFHLIEPKMFDIVIFHATEEKDYIKRVIGLSGEHVEVKNDQLYIDGKEKDAYFLNSKDEEVNTEDSTLESLPGNYK